MDYKTTQIKTLSKTLFDDVFGDPDLLQIIFEFDCTYKEKFDNVLNEFKITNSIRNKTYSYKEIFEDIEKLEASYSFKFSLIENISIKEYLKTKSIKKRNIVIKIINKNPWLYNFLPEGFKHDEGIVNLTFQKNTKVFKHFPFEKKKRYLEKIIKKDITNFNQIESSDITFFPFSVIELVKEAIENDVNNFRFFSKNLQDNLEVINIVQRKLFSRLAKNLSPLKKVDKSIINNKKIMFDIIEKYPMALKSCSVLNSDREIVLAAVRQNGNTYKFASDELKNDLEIVLASYQYSNNFYHYFSQQNKELIDLFYCEIN